MCRKESCYIIPRHAFFKDEPVKHTIDQITQCAGKYQGGTNNKSTAVFLLNNVAKVPHAKNNCPQSEQGQEHLASDAPKFPTIGHSLVFSEIQPEPRTPYI